MVSGLVRWLRQGPRPVVVGLSSLALAAVALVGVVLFQPGTSSTTENAPLGFTYEGTKLDGLAPDFRLVDQNGATMALADFRGKVVALAFLDTACTDVCPLTANQFRLTAEALGKNASRVVLLAVNVNPKRNSVADVAEATAKWGVQNLTNWHYLTGSREELEPVYQAYNVEAEGRPKPNKPNELEHTPGVFLIDRAGNQRKYISTAFDLSISLSELLVKNIRALLR